MLRHPAYTWRYILPKTKAEQRLLLTHGTKCSAAVHHWEFCCAIFLFFAFGGGIPIQHHQKLKLIDLRRWITRDFLSKCEGHTGKLPEIGRKWNMHFIQQTQQAWKLMKNLPRVTRRKMQFTYEESRGINIQARQDSMPVILRWSALAVQLLFSGSWKVCFLESI